MGRGNISVGCVFCISSTVGNIKYICESSDCSGKHIASRVNQI